MTVIFAFAFTASRIVPTYHLDGAFQTYASLNRFTVGSWPGRDFLPYLGIGPPALLFPLYKIAGANLGASVFSATAMTLITVSLSWGTCAVFTLRTRSWLLISLFTALPIVLVSDFMLPIIVEYCPPLLSPNINAIAELSTPGFSLRPIRSCAPYLLALTLTPFLLPRLRSSMFPAGFAGASIGIVGAIWAADYALVSSILALLTAVVLLATRPHRRKAHFVVLLTTTVVSALSLALLATAGHPYSYYHYIFYDMRGDQFWYYAPWNESTRIFKVSDFSRALATEQVWGSIVFFVILIAISMVKRSYSLLILIYIGMSLLAGGFIATYGGHMGGYFSPFKAYSLAVFVIALIASLGSAVFRFTSFTTGRSVARDARAAVLCVLTSLLIGTLGYSAYTQATTIRSDEILLTSSPDYVYMPRFGGYLDRRWAHIVSMGNQSPKPLVEEYSGLLTAIWGPNSSVHVDSIIHALGKERRLLGDYVSHTRPLVVTTAPEMDPGWVSWSLSANWWFYRTLFSGYVPTRNSPTTIVWTPSQAAFWPKVGCEVQNSGQSVEVRTHGGGLHELLVRYNGPGYGLRAFSMLRNGINNGGEAGGYVALDPNAGSQAIPVFVSSSTPERFGLLNVPQSRLSLTTIKSCQIREIRVPAGANTLQIYGDVVNPSNSPSFDDYLMREADGSRPRLAVSSTWGSRNRMRVERRSIPI